MFLHRRLFQKVRISAAEETSTTTCHYPCRGGPWMHLLSRSQNFKAYTNVENGSAIQRNHDARGKVPALKTATCCGPCWRGPWMHLLAWSGFVKLVRMLGHVSRTAESHDICDPWKLCWPDVVLSSWSQS